jgi:monoamine oxidase
MHTDILIVGGGISGLTTAWQLQQAGLNVCLIEARDRVGGRILTREEATCDMGPSWYWPGQPLIASLLEKLEIPSFEQNAQGKVLWQDAQGHVQKYPMASPMAGALRIQGGTGALTQRIATRISPKNLRLQHVLNRLQIHGDGVRAKVQGPDGDLEILAKQIALAIPPRVAGALSFTPELPADVQTQLTSTPTWMAGHAKFFALYDEPFWRERGLCGTAMSQRGPLGEIHDASPDTNDGYSLFGFIGWDSKTRTQLGETELIAQITKQLVEIYGEQARALKKAFLQDWSTEPFTAGPGDQAQLRHHPRYGLNPELGEAWTGRLKFISSESSFTHGGLIEGALEAAQNYAKTAIGSEACSAHPARGSQPNSKLCQWL